MDRVPCDCHCSYRCWSRTGEPAAGHPHRGGWYVFAKTKLQLQFQSTLLNLPCQILTALPISTNPPLLFYPLCLLLIWLSTLSSFNPIFGQCFFKRKETHFAKSTIFWLFYIPQFQHMVWHFQQKASKLPVPTVIFETFTECHRIFHFFLFFLRTWQIEDSGQNKRWKIFFEGHFLKSFFCLSSCDTVIFNPFFFLAP